MERKKLCFPSEPFKPWNRCSRRMGSGLSSGRQLTTDNQEAAATSSPQEEVGAPKTVSSLAQEIENVDNKVILGPGFGITPAGTTALTAPDGTNSSAEVELSAPSNTQEHDSTIGSDVVPAPVPALEPVPLPETVLLPAPASPSNEQQTVTRPPDLTPASQPRLKTTSTPVNAKRNNDAMSTTAARDDNIFLQPAGLPIMYRDHSLAAGTREALRPQRERKKRDEKLQRRNEVVSREAARVRRLEEMVGRKQRVLVTAAIEHCAAIIIQTRVRIFLVIHRIKRYKAGVFVSSWISARLIRYGLFLRRLDACSIICRLFARCVARSRRQKRLAGARIDRFLALNVARKRNRSARSAARTAISLVTETIVPAATSRAEFSLTKLADLTVAAKRESSVSIQQASTVRPDSVQSASPATSESGDQPPISHSPPIHKPSEVKKGKGGGVADSSTLHTVMIDRRKTLGKPLFSKVKSAPTARSTPTPPTPRAPSTTFITSPDAQATELRMGSGQTVASPVPGKGTPRPGRSYRPAATPH